MMPQWPWCRLSLNHRPQGPASGAAAAHQGQVALGSRAREIFIDPGQVFLPLVHISYVPVQSSFVFLTRQVRGMVLGTACQSWPDVHRTSRVGVPLLSTSRPQDHSDWLAMKMR